MHDTILLTMSVYTLFIYKMSKPIYKDINFQDANFSGKKVLLNKLEQKHYEKKKVEERSN